MTKMKISRKSTFGNISDCNYGWLSFNETTGCPGGGDCTPRFNSKTNTLSGWAKFLAADSSTGIWDGWVSLSTKPGESHSYTAHFDSSTQKFVSNTSWAWGSHIAGWINFYDVSMGLKTAQAPILEPVSNSEKCDANNKCSVDFKLTNPQDYPFGMKLFQSITEGSEYFERTDINLPSTKISDYIFTVTDLEPSSTYSFFVRGCFTKVCEL
ncbi:hypothetical protein VJY32_03055 [Ignavibacteria bacterium 4148-Me]|uniref:hypothetical protein n=1 Tax=Rosettibacter primus TaxID=3111523 RepID=UPI00336C19D0